MFRSILAIRRFLLGITALLLIGYLVIAFGVHHAFPFYVFDMFDMPPVRSASRILVRSANGAVSDVRSHVGWQCPQPPLPPTAEQMARCGMHLWSRSRDSDALRWIAAHSTGRSAAAGPRVELIRRIWSLEEAQPAHRDCFLATCTLEAE